MKTTQLNSVCLFSVNLKFFGPARRVIAALEVTDVGLQFEVDSPDVLLHHVVGGEAVVADVTGEVLDALVDGVHVVVELLFRVESWKRKK